MKLRFLLVAMVMMLGSIAPSRQIQAASCVLLSGTAPSTGKFQFLGAFNIIAGHQILYELNVTPGTPDYTTTTSGLAGPFSGPISKILIFNSNLTGASLDTSTPDGTTISYKVTDLSCSGGSGDVTWFNPGDGRVDGKPGDRLAVWCNTDEDPQTIVVYGIGDQTNGSNGFFLFKVTPEKVEANSESIRAINAGPGNGTVSIDGDGKGDFYIAWNGGIFNATGQGPFAKTVYCDFD